MSAHDALRDDLSALALGELDLERSAVVLEHVEGCAECSSTLELLSDAARLALHPRLMSKSGIPSTARRWLWVAAAAALVLVSFFAVAPWLRSSDRGGLAALADRSVPPFVAAELRGTELPVTAEFAAAMERWEAKDFRAAERSLSGFLDAHEDHSPARFYRGVARRELGDLGGARSDLARVAASATGVLREHAFWCLASVELLSGDPEAAQRALESVRASDGDYAANASALQQRIENAR